MKARILYLNDTPKVTGGAEYQITRLIPAARDAGMEVFVACIPGSAAETQFEAAGAKIIPLRNLRANPVIAVRDIKRICRTRSIDLILTGSFLGNFSGRIAGRWARLPVISTVHCEPDSYLLAKPSFSRRLVFGIRSLIDKTMAGYTSVFIAVSQAVADKLISRGIPKRKITVISNGIDSKAVREAATSGLVKVTRDDPKEVLIGTLTRLDPVKGLDVLINAVAILIQRGLSIKALIVGDGAEKQALEKLAIELGISKNIVFIGYMDNPYAQLAELDAYAVSSHSEGQNLSVLVAMALDLPVIATEVGGIVDMVTNDITGLLVPSSAPRELADAIQRLTKDRALRERLVKKSDSLLKKFTVEEMCEQTMNVYQTILEK